MKTKAIPVEAIEILASGTLDPIQVFWVNLAPGAGHVTITCWGCAWTCYFGAMSEMTIQRFFASADTSYLVSKLGITPLLKKKGEAYLGRIIDAIKAAMRERSEGVIA